MTELAAKLEEEANIDFQKKHKLGKDKEEYNAQFKTTKDAFKELEPFNIKKQLFEIKSMTPEEYETILRCLEEFKVNAKMYAFLFSFAAVSFSYWQRHVLPRAFYPFALVTGIATGSAYGIIKTGAFAAERVDALGKDYEISRMMK